MPLQIAKIMNKPNLKSSQRGIAIIEAMVALLIFSMGVLALVGLQATMVKNTSDAKYRSDASYIAQNRLGQIWADIANAANYIETNTDISSLLPSGTRSVSSVATNQYRVTVTWRLPGQVQHNFTTTASIVN